MRDFDGTIVKHQIPEIGEEIPFAIQTLRMIQSELETSYYTLDSQGGGSLDEAVEYCRSEVLSFMH